MSTHFVTFESAPYRDFAEPKADSLDHPQAPSGLDQLIDNDFFAGKSIEQSGKEQGVGPATDIRIFAGGIPDDEDVDEMIAELYKLREL